MNAEFNWWLLMVGLVVGAGLVWFVVADQRRREVDIDADERAREALWLSASLADEGHEVPPETAERLLALHRAYLEAPPPDAPPPAAAPPDAPPPAAAPPDAPPPAAAPPRDELGSEPPGDDRRPVDQGAVEVRE